MKEESNQSSRVLGILLPLVFFLIAGTVLKGEHRASELLEVHHFEVEDFDHSSLDAVRFPPDEDIFVALDARLTTLGETNRPFIITVVPGQPHDSDPLVLLAEPHSIVFDAKHRRLFFFEATTSELVEVWLGPDSSVGLEEVARLSASELGLVEPRGMAVDPSGESLYVFDRAREMIVQLDLRGDLERAAPVHLSDHRVSTVVLEARGLPALGGLAYDPSSHHFLILSSSLASLYEFSDTGDLVGSHDVSDLELVDPVRLLFARSSADLTDDLSVMHLYLADGGPEGEALESRIREFSLSAPSLLLAPAASREIAAAATETASLVQIIDTSAFSRRRVPTRQASRISPRWARFWRATRKSTRCRSSPGRMSSR